MGSVAGFDYKFGDKCVGYYPSPDPHTPAPPSHTSRPLLSISGLVDAPLWMDPFAAIPDTAPNRRPRSARQQDGRRIRANP